MNEIIPNTTIHIGTVAIFQYSKIKHIAQVIKISENGFWIREANYEPAKISKRFIYWDDKSLVGFWSGR